MKGGKSRAYKIQTSITIEIGLRRINKHCLSPAAQRELNKKKMTAFACKDMHKFSQLFHVNNLLNSKGIKALKITISKMNNYNNFTQRMDDLL